jgi:hypothetical protein
MIRQHITALHNLAGDIVGCGMPAPTMAMATEHGVELHVADTTALRKWAAWLDAPVVLEDGTLRHVHRVSVVYDRTPVEVVAIRFGPAERLPNQRAAS